MLKLQWFVKWLKDKDMATFSLLTVSKEKDGIVEGYWIQDHIGTLETATERAKSTSELNRGQNIAVVDGIRCTSAILGFWKNQIKLN